MLLPPGGKNWQLAFNCYNIKIHEKKIFKSVQKQQNWTVVVRRVIEESIISNFESQLKFQVKEKKFYSNWSRKNEIML